MNKKYKIVAPVRTYNGLSGGVYFTQGVGYTDDDHLAKWFKSRGYEVIEQNAAPKKEAKAAKEEDDESKIEIPKEVAEKVIEEDDEQEEEEEEGEADESDTKPANSRKVKRNKK